MIPDRNTATTTLRDATHPNDPTATDAWLATGPCVQFSDAMTHIGHACDQALADARLITTRDLDGPLHGLVTDLHREKAAAVACRAIFESHLAAAVGVERAKLRPGAK